MSDVRSNFLRAVIGADAAVCGIGGAALVFDAGLLAGPLGLPANVLQIAGEGLVVYAALLAFLATRTALPRAVVWALVALNVAWAIETALLPVLGWAQPDGLGLTLLLFQAAGALLVADLQWLSLRRPRVAA